MPRKGNSSSESGDELSAKGQATEHSDVLLVEDPGEPPPRIARALQNGEPRPEDAQVFLGRSAPTLTKLALNGVGIVLVVVLLVLFGWGVATEVGATWLGLGALIGLTLSGALVANFRHLWRMLWELEKGAWASGVYLFEDVMCVWLKDVPSFEVKRNRVTSMETLTYRNPNGTHRKVSEIKYFDDLGEVEKFSFSNFKLNPTYALERKIRRWSRGRVYRSLDEVEGRTSPVLVLDLSSSSLERVPDELLELRDLRRLDMSINLLSDLPKELVVLDELRVLDIRSNQFRRPPGVLPELGDLRALLYQGNLVPPLTEGGDDLEELYLWALGLEQVDVAESMTARLASDGTERSVAVLGRLLHDGDIPDDRKHHIRIAWETLRDEYGEAHAGRLSLGPPGAGKGDLTLGTEGGELSMMRTSRNRFRPTLL